MIFLIRFRALESLAQPGILSSVLAAGNQARAPLFALSNINYAPGSGPELATRFHPEIFIFAQRRRGEEENVFASVAFGGFKQRHLDEEQLRGKTNETTRSSVVQTCH